MTVAEKISQSRPDDDGFEGVEIQNAEADRQGRGRRQHGGLQGVHSLPRGEARGQAAERDIEQFLAAARAHEAGETLRRSQRERPRADCARQGRLDELGHELGARRDDEPRTGAPRLERRDAAAQSLDRVEGARQRRVAAIILAAEMAREAAIIGFLGQFPFVQQAVDRPDPPRRRGQRIEQRFRRKPFRGEESQFRRSEGRSKLGPRMARRASAIARPLGFMRRERDRLAALPWVSRHGPQHTDPAAPPCSGELTMRGATTGNIRHNYSLLS